MPSPPTSTTSAGTPAASLDSPASRSTPDSISRVLASPSVTRASATAPTLISPSASIHNNSQNTSTARPYVLAISADVPAPRTDHTPETPAIVAATESQDDANLGMTSNDSQKKAPARASRRTAAKTAPKPATKTTKETVPKAATKAATKTATKPATKPATKTARPKKAPAPKVCPGRYVSSLYFYSCYIYTYIHYRELCFKEWRKSQKDGVPDSAFDSYWGDLSAKAKKVRIILGSCTTSTYTLRYRLRSGMEGPGVGRCTLSSLPRQLPLLTLCFYRRRTPDRVRPSKASVLSLECFWCGRVAYLERPRGAWAGVVWVVVRGGMTRVYSRSQ